MDDERFNPHYDQPDVDFALRLARRAVGLKRMDCADQQSAQIFLPFDVDVKQELARMIQNDALTSG